MEVTIQSAQLDGMSISAVLLGQEMVRPRGKYLYWQSVNNGRQTVGWGDWKAQHQGVRGDRNAKIQSFDLANDLSETTDVAA